MITDSLKVRDLSLDPQFPPDRLGIPVLQPLVWPSNGTALN